jgi:hypothetical protein
MLDFVHLGEFEVTYLDGTKETARSNFGAIMEMEQEYQDVENVPGATVLVRAMWLYLGRPKESLDQWARNVHHIEPVAKTDGRPTRPAAGDG